MSEPTIDEMLEWLSSYDRGIPLAIRAILEQHRDSRAMHQKDLDDLHFVLQQHNPRIAREAIRAFVERVERRHRALPDDKVISYYKAVHDELAAMEAE